MTGVLVGRRAELDATAAFLDVAARRPAALVLDGEAGIGKTALWAAGVAEARRRGFRVLSAEPTEAETLLPYVSLADLLGQVEDAVLDRLPVPQRRAVDGVLLRAAGPAPVDHRSVAVAFLGVLERLSEAGPVLLAIDDVQWVDASSALVLGYGLRRLAVAAGVLATCRTGADDDGARLVRLPQPEQVQRVRIAPLTLSGLHQMLEERGLPRTRGELTRIQEVSGGNPFYALELARGGDALPGSLANAVRARLADLDVEVLLAVAVAADPTAELVMRVFDGVDAIGRLEAAERAGVVRIDGQRIRFTHPLLAAGVEAAVSPPDRRNLHGRLAAVVPEPERRARHLALSAVRADAATLAALDDAAERAGARGAPAAAAELLGMALDRGGDTPQRRVLLARHLFASGDSERARALLEAAVATLPAGPDRAAALQALAIVRLHDDSYAEAAACLEQALAEAGAEARLRVQVLLDLPFVLVNLGRIPDALAMVGETLTAAESLGDPGLVAVARAESVINRFLAGEGLDAPMMARALADENPLTPVPVMLRPSLIHGLLLMWTGRLAEARTAMLAVRRDCLERGAESDLMFSAFHLVTLECWRGDLAGARLIAEDTAERAALLGTEMPSAIALATRAAVAAHAGDAAEARRCAHAALEIFQRGSCVAVMVWPLVTLGFLDVSRGDHAAAAATLAPLAAAAAAMGYGEPTAAPFAPDAIEALVGLGRLDEARVLVDQLLANGRRLDRAWALAVGGRCRALLLAAEGDLVGASDVAEAAMTEHDRLPMPLERARTLLVLGRIRRRRRQKRAAAMALQGALAVFEELGVTLWAAQARADLDRVGVGPLRAEELTPSERRVAELVARGMTNREVGTVLFISPKTVEANLARVYRKLAVRSRAELGGRLAASE